MRGVGLLRRWSRAVGGAVRRRSPRGLILLYHRIAGPRFDPMLLDVSPPRFEAQLAVLRTHASVLPLDEFESLRRAGRLPRRAVAVTFDDGYADNLLAAAPLLHAAAIPATIFVTAGMVDGDREFWWDDLERIAFTERALGAGIPVPGIPWTAETRAPSIDRTWTVSHAVPRTARQDLFLALCEGVRGLPSPERDARVGALREWAGVPAQARSTHRTMTLAELRSLAAVAGITIGAHTMTHPQLSRQAPDVQRQELQESRERLSAAIGTEVWFAAYPFGTTSDVSATTVQAARASAFRAALANTATPAWRWSSRWRLPRYLVRDWDAATFEQQLRHWWEA